MKVFWVFNHPAPYKVDFFNVLGKLVDLTVVFERHREKGRNATFYSQKAINYHETIANSIYLGGIDNYTHVPIKFLKKKQFDLVVINGWRTLTERRTISYCRKHHIPYLFYINGGIVPKKEANWKAKLKRKYISNADYYLAPEESSKAYLTHYGAEESKIAFYPYSTVFEKEVLKAPLPLEEKNVLRKKFGIQGKKVFVSTGQFIPRKNFEQLIRIWPKMPEDYVLYIVGEGPLKSQYEATIRELGLKNVCLHPFMKHADLLSFFSCCDAFIFLSKEDIYGHVINEALTQGIPVIASKGSNSATQLIQSGINGFLVNLDEEEIVKAANSLNEEMAIKASELAQTNTIEHSAKVHFEYFQELLHQQ